MQGEDFETNKDSAFHKEQAKTQEQKKIELERMQKKASKLVQGLKDLFTKRKAKHDFDKGDYAFYVNLRMQTDMEGCKGVIDAQVRLYETFYPLLDKMARDLETLEEQQKILLSANGDLIAWKKVVEHYQKEGKLGSDLERILSEIQESAGNSTESQDSITSSKKLLPLEEYLTSLDVTEDSSLHGNLSEASEKPEQKQGE